jgi:membrane associated rhomboid family serine protease
MITLVISCSFLYQKLYSNSTEELYKLHFSPFAFDIYSGAYYGVFLNSFLHNNIINLLINGLFLFHSGRIIERKFKFTTYFLLGLFASSSTSIIQLAASGDPGIGLFGVNFFLISIIVFSDYKIKEISIKIKRNYILLLLFTITVCTFGNIYFKWNIGLASMVSGFLLGALLGLLAAFRGRKRSIFFGFFLTCFLSVSLFYSPWSEQWNLYKAITYHEKNEIHLATSFYKKVLQINPTEPISIENLNLIKIDKLSNHAYKLHNKGQFIQARFYYDQILAIDPHNKWAKDQIQKLP